MKKLLFIFLCCPLIFTSCKKEETDDNTSFSVIGTWDFVSVNSINTIGYYTNYPDGKVITNTIDITSVPGDSILDLDYWTMEFQADGTHISHAVTLNNINFPPDTTTWQKVGDNLIIGGEECPITTLTNSSLVYIRYNSEMDTDEYGIVSFDDSEAIYTFAR